ncbi:M10 family metallopeptidase C-terminal domain-containing protein [Microvirga splendida]|uniref:Calcium-binding protein n=1 Tax=Microvirga splendida TaxID=2795727 RepID=A0ABS0Y894_9HYPH|nr:calcium-binding protein [Microvirga splendida]MBJ6128498.1 calcium-binding protein [Microvirga splendida]
MANTPTIFTMGFDGDYTRIIEDAEPTRLDWNGNAQVVSGYGIYNIQVAVFSADPQHDFLGIAPGSGVTASPGFPVGSGITIGGVQAIVMPGGSGTHNFHIQFPDLTTPEEGDYTVVDPWVAQQFIRALTYQNTSETLPDNFQRQVFVSVANEVGDHTQDIVTFTKWLPHHGPDTGGSANNPGGGGNLPPSIAGNLASATISEAAAPFSQVTVTDQNGDNLTLTVGISDPSRGSFLASSLSGGTYNPVTGIYSVSGTPAQVQAALMNLVFVKAPYAENAPASVVPLSFTVSVSDGMASTSKIFSASLWFNRADTIKGSSRSEKLYGESGKDKLYGHAGNDLLDGGSGADTLFGGTGNDKVYGGTGKDVFVFDTRPNKRSNVDKIYDFKSRDDSIHLDNKYFTKLGSGSSKGKKFKSDMFVEGKKAKDAEDRIVYDKKTGALYYDQDGTGSKAQVKIATITNKTTLKYHDFFVI